MFPGKAVRIVSVRKQADFYVHPFFQQHVNTPDTGFDSGAVTIIEYSDVIGEAMDHPYLFGCQCRTR